MKILLVSPETPVTFWSFRHALRFIAKKSSEPPLGLITVASLLPTDWEKKLVDMNVSTLSNKQIKWADYVFLTGMNVHLESFKQVVKRCNAMNVKVVAGGPMCTTDYEQFEGVDHFILNEAEITLPRFLHDLENGNPERIYRSDEYPDLGMTPVPDWHLLNMKHYASMSVQFSRGCPFNCEFCSVTLLNGHKPRIKSVPRFMGELDSLYQHGWRGNVFIVDDNFIGNKRRVKTELLPALINWQERHNQPFEFLTQVSINLADDKELVDLLVKAGMRTVFVGIETPNQDSLTECGKGQNLKRDIVGSVKLLQQHGLMVHGGFIIGFDHDTPSIFEAQIRFIQQSGIVTAMVGLLTALSGTQLYKRLKREDRLLKTSTGNNMDGALNFVPTMNKGKLIDGYKKVLNTIYSQKDYYERVKSFLNEYRLPDNQKLVLKLHDIRAFIRSIWLLGVVEKGRSYYWKLIIYTLKTCPAKLHLAVTLAIYGFHFRRIIKTV